MNYLDLFSGIGGFALGAYMAGVKVDNHLFSDIEEYSNKLYKTRFPDAIELGDISKINTKELLEKYGNDWIITGGFPCQDISIAGRGAGLDGKRSGLWFEMWRIIRDLRPKYVIAENVSALTFRGLDRVISSLAEIGYDAEWQDIRARDMGAPHRRERIWIIAYPNSKRYIHGQIKEQPTKNREHAQRNSSSIYKNDAYPNMPQFKGNKRTIGIQSERAWPDSLCKSFIKNSRCKHGEAWGEIAERLQGQFREWNSCDKFERQMQTRAECEVTAGVTRMDDGVSSRVDRLKGCGNAIVPQIAKELFLLCENHILTTIETHDTLIP